LTATYVNGDTAPRPPTTPVDTVSSGTHSNDSASARPSGNFDSHTGSRPYTLSDSHSDSQSDNSVNDYRVTFTHSSNQTVSRFYDRLKNVLRLCLSQITRVGQKVLSLTYVQKRQIDKHTFYYSTKSPPLLMHNLWC